MSKTKRFVCGRCGEKMTGGRSHAKLHGDPVPVRGLASVRRRKAREVPIGPGGIIVNHTMQADGSIGLSLY